MDTNQAKAFMSQHKEGTYTLLDVRQPGEYEKSRIPGARLIPLPDLLNHIEELSLEKPVIVYWAVGGRSRAAAQLLSGQGFKEVYNLKGGIKEWQGLEATGPIEMGMALIKGDETPEEIIVFAYGMEAGLRDFYQLMSNHTAAEKVSDTFTKLSDIEEKHKNKLFRLYQYKDSSISDESAFEKQVVNKVMEGGVTVEEFAYRNRAAIKTVTNVLELAMSIETQSLDLYLRYSQKSGDPETQKVLFEIADEEKLHLMTLAKLMDENL